jgi:putative selenium metabolism protein SsnA
VTRDVLITDGVLVTCEQPARILTGSSLLLSEGKIAALGGEAELRERYPDAERLSASGQMVLPGNICAHTHFYGAFARGMSIPGVPPAAFPAMLEKLWWPLDKSLDLEDVRSSALVCLVDAIRHGTTTLIDHHASPNALDGSLDVLAEAVGLAGVRAVLCYEVTDRDGAAKAKAGIDENVRFLRRCEAGPVAGGRVAAAFGLHASLTLSEKTLAACRAAAPQDTAFHMHLAEHEVDEEDCLAKYGERVASRLLRHGILGSRTILAHGVHIDESEMRLLAEAGAWVTHQPRSNMNNGVGVAPIEAMQAAGVRLGLGNDGFSNAMWEEWKAAYLVHKLWNRDPRRMPGNRVADIAWQGNAALAGAFFPEAPLGRLVPGAHADLIFVDYHPTTPLTPGNLPWHVLFGFHESMVTTTIVGGRVLMQDRRLCTLDEDSITAESRHRAGAVWSRYDRVVPRG